MGLYGRGGKGPLLGAGADGGVGGTAGSGDLGFELEAADLPTAAEVATTDSRWRSSASSCSRLLRWNIGKGNRRSACAASLASSGTGMPSSDAAV